MSYVIDTSAAINLERQVRLHKLPAPGGWIVLPSIVADELNPNYRGTPEATKKWLLKGKIASFSSNEEELYRLLILNPAVDDGEAQAISMAHYRQATLVIDEKRDGTVWKIAESYGIKCITSDELWTTIFPRLPGI